MKKVVLVIDDNRVSRLLPGFMLHPFSEQIKVFECERGSDALRVLETEPVTHVLLDISMPDFDGIQVAKAMSALSPLVSLRLIAYTADVRAVEDQDLKSAGFDAVLLKPIKTDDLLRVLDLSG
jgi:two-component system, cell cycle response regulator DivK